jgi:hypothetical protein
VTYQWIIKKETKNPGELASVFLTGILPDSNLKSEVNMKRLSIITLVFSVAFLVMFMAPPFLNEQFGIYPLMQVGDVFDIFTPLILILLYWLVFRLNTDKAPGLTATLIFLLFVAFWVTGQGMHLAANSIGHLLKGMEGSDLYNLTYFYDEVLSHYLWHFGIFGLSIVIIFQQWRNPFTEGQSASWLPISAGIIHGFTLFVIIIEAGTAPLGVTFTILMAVFSLIWGRRRFSQQPLLLFFFIACLVAILLFAGWAIYWQGLPEFSEVGIID